MDLPQLLTALGIVAVDVVGGGADDLWLTIGGDDERRAVGFALLRARVGRQSVTTLAVWQHGDVQRDPVLRGFYAQLADIVFSPTHPAMRSFWEPGEQALRQGLRGVEPASALAAAQQQLERYLQPPPATASQTPYLVLMALLLVGGAAYAVRRGQQQRVLRALGRKPVQTGLAKLVAHQARLFARGLQLRTILI